jgi:hypothetical protein
MEKKMEDDIVFDVEVRVIVDDVSGGAGREFRASVYRDGELWADGWGADAGLAVGDAFAFGLFAKGVE